MKTFLASILCATCVWGHTNEAHLAGLVSHPKLHPGATNRNAALSGYIPTNTVAYQKYALEVLLSEANRVNHAWSLGLPDPITSDHVTRFMSSPKISGVSGGMTVLDRYHFIVDNGRFEEYYDGNERWRSLDQDITRQEQLINIKAAVSKRTARQMAFTALAQLGLTNQPHVRQEPELIQQHYEDDNDKMHLLPFFVVRWGQASIEMEISGVSGKIVSYYNYGAPANIPVPANYYAMLGISPDHTTWGRKLGYDPIDTDAFQSFAAHLVTDQMNQLIDTWHLSSRPLTTNDIVWFFAKPRTNDFNVCARFSDRFLLQIMARRVNIFYDEARNLSAYVGEPARIQEALKETNLISPAVAEAAARKAIASLGLDLKTLGLREPPTIKRLTTDLNDKPVELPLYDVSWWRDAENAIPGNDYPAVALHISATSGMVVTYGNSTMKTPQIPLPTNYSILIGSPSQTRIVPDLRSQNERK